MLIATLKTLFNRDLKRLLTEIEQYQNEAGMWKLGGEIKNSAGNLCLHLVGNLNCFIGNELGKTGYVRNRDWEFSATGVPRQELVQRLNDTMEMIEQTLDSLNEEDLAAEFPILVFDHKMSTEFFLVHLATHLNYHLGQINYHRRILGATAL